MSKQRVVNYFNRSKEGKQVDGWLHKLGLQLGQVVLVNGRPFRYSQERDGKDHVLTPVEV